MTPAHHRPAVPSTPSCPESHSVTWKLRPMRRVPDPRFPFRGFRAFVATTPLLRPQHVLSWRFLLPRRPVPYSAPSGPFLRFLSFVLSWLSPIPRVAVPRRARRQEPLSEQRIKQPVEQRSQQSLEQPSKESAKQSSEQSTEGSAERSSKQSAQRFRQGLAEQPFK